MIMIQSKSLNIRASKSFSKWWNILNHNNYFALSLEELGFFFEIVERKSVLTNPTQKPSEIVLTHCRILNILVKTCKFFLRTFEAFHEMLFKQATGFYNREMRVEAHYLLKSQLVPS